MQVKLRSVLSHNQADPQASAQLFPQPRHHTVQSSHLLLQLQHQRINLVRSKLSRIRRHIAGRIVRCHHILQSMSHSVTFAPAALLPAARLRGLDTYRRVSALRYCVEAPAPASSRSKGRTATPPSSPSGSTSSSGPYSSFISATRSAAWTSPNSGMFDGGGSSAGSSSLLMSGDGFRAGTRGFVTLSPGCQPCGRVFSQHNQHASARRLPARNASQSATAHELGATTPPGSNRPSNPRSDATARETPRRTARSYQEINAVSIIFAGVRRRS